MKSQAQEAHVQGNTIGIANSNPILDTRTYEVEFEDGRMITYYANTIIRKYAC